MDAEDDVGVFEFFGHFLIIDVGGADAFVYVLGGKVVTQHFGGARVAVFAAKAVKQGGTALVEGVDDAGVAHGEVDVAVAYPFGFVGIEKVGFGFEVAAECFVGVGDVFLNGSVGQDDLEQDDGGAVQYGAAQNHKGVGQPVGLGGVGEGGVGGDGECAECEGAVFEPDRA